MAFAGIDYGNEYGFVWEKFANAGMAGISPLESGP
jgi:hypothetical protein